MKSRFPYLKFSHQNLSPSKNDISFDLDLRPTLESKHLTLSNKSESNLNSTISVPLTIGGTPREGIASRKRTAPNHSYYYEELRKIEDLIESKELENKVSKYKNDRDGWEKV